MVMTNDNYVEGHLEQPDGLAVLGFFVDVSSDLLSCFTFVILE